MRNVLLVILGCCSSASNVEEYALTPHSLRVNSQEEPLDVDVSDRTGLTFSWLLSATKDGAYGALQGAAHVQVWHSISKRPVKLLWDSGRVAQQETALLYQGPTLPQREHFLWYVRVWREDIVGPWSPPASFTTAPSWVAAWIASPVSGSDAGGNLMRTTFEVAQQEVSQAIISVVGLGHYELRLNGVKLGTSVVDPGWTNYKKTCLYTTYANLSLQTGVKNTIGVLLGNGMYNVPGNDVSGNPIRYTKFVGSFGPRTLRLQLDITYANGSSQTIVSGHGWQVTRGPMTLSHTYAGEDFDASLEEDGWDTSDFNASHWDTVEEWAGPGCIVSPQTISPLNVMETHRAIRYWTPTLAGLKASPVTPNSTVFDLGPTFAGWPRIRVQGTRGTTLRLWCGELLANASGYRGDMPQPLTGAWPVMSFGRFYQFQYTLKGKGSVEEWEPRFSFSGFRWVQVEVLPQGRSEGLEFFEIEGRVVYSSNKKVGTFHCDVPLFNSIHDIVVRSMKANMFSVWADCPHREKLGWLEVSHLMAPSIMYNFDIELLYRKILQDISEAQRPNGLVPDIAPEFTVFADGFVDSPEWGSAFVFLAKFLEQVYMDSSPIAQYYPQMAAYVRYLSNKRDRRTRTLAYGLGDWCDSHSVKGGCGPEGQWTKLGVTGTAIWYADCVLMARFAEKVAPAEVNQWRALAAEAKAAYISAFWNETSQSFGELSQTANAMPIALGMLEDDHLNDFGNWASYKAGALRALIADIEAHGMHQTGGDIGHRFILQALQHSNRSDIISAVTARRDTPSYGAIIAAGATSLTEEWDGGGSQLHTQLGHIDEWFYSGLAGIQLDLSPHVSTPIRLIPAGTVKEVSKVEASYHSVLGLIESSWNRSDNGTFQLQVTIPLNAVATVHVPAAIDSEVHVRSLDDARSFSNQAIQQKRDAHGVEFLVHSGKYSFTSKVFMLEQTAVYI